MSRPFSSFPRSVARLPAATQEFSRRISLASILANGDQPTNGLALTLKQYIDAMRAASNDLMAPAAWENYLTRFCPRSDLPTAPSSKVDPEDFPVGDYILVTILTDLNGVPWNAQDMQASKQFLVLPAWGGSVYLDILPVEVSSAGTFSLISADSQIRMRELATELEHAYERLHALIKQ